MYMRQNQDYSLTHSDSHSISSFTFSAYFFPIFLAFVIQSFQANRHPPILHTHDRYGNRIDEVEFHPAYHDLMDLSLTNQVASYAWNNKDKKAPQVGRG